MTQYLSLKGSFSLYMKIRQQSQNCLVRVSSSRLNRGGWGDGRLEEVAILTFSVVNFYMFCRCFYSLVATMMTLVLYQRG